MKIYLAAPWPDRELARAFAARLTDRGFAITRDWWNHECVGDDPIKYRQYAMDDWAAVLSADALVLLNTQKRGEETSGKAVETGIAISRHIPVIVVGGWTNIFHFLPGVSIVPTTEEVFDELIQRSWSNQSQHATQGSK